MGLFEITNIGIIAAEKNKNEPTEAERFKNIRFILKPKRKKPDLTIVEASNRLAQLVGHSPYDFTNYLDIDHALRALHNLDNADRAKLSQFITPASDGFVYSVRSILDVKNGKYLISLNSNRKPLNTSLTSLTDYSDLISLKYDNNNKVMSIETFYPTNATLRGYSVGLALINKLEKYSKVVGATTIRVEYPTLDSRVFYQKAGFDNTGIKYIQ